MTAGDQECRTQGATPDQLHLQVLAPASTEACYYSPVRTPCWVMDHAGQFWGDQAALRDRPCEGAPHWCGNTVHGGHIRVCSAHAACWKCGHFNPDSLKLVTYKAAGVHESWYSNGYQDIALLGWNTEVGVCLCLTRLSVFHVV